MSFPKVRMRRLRANEAIRSLISETSLSTNDLIAPLFATEEASGKEEIASMPGQFRHSIPSLVAECEELYSIGVKAVMVFGIPKSKDELGSQAYSDAGVAQRAIAAIKKAVPQILVVSDVCLCEYSSHGHCGVIEGERLLNDPTLDLLARTAVSHARAGADMVAPSDMMDGRVAALREALDKRGFQGIPIMSYAAKYCSAFYGPFRDAAGSAPSFGDRRSYQMDPANSREAMREIALDLEEGADIIMVKPALAYLDVIKTASERFDAPIAAYNVSGEYSMIKAAAAAGWLDEKRAATEALTSIKRAGAKIIITYHAKDCALWLKDGFLG